MSRSTARTRFEIQFADDDAYIRLTSRKAPPLSWQEAIDEIEKFLAHIKARAAKKTELDEVPVAAWEQN